MIYTNDDAKLKLQEGVNLIANIVKQTLGPKGKNVILFNGDDEAFMTKDGISVAKKVRSTNSAVEAGIQIMREASAKTADQAGDGSTTSLILAQALFNKGIEMLNAGHNIVEIKEAFAKGVELIKSNISNFSRQVTFDYNTLKYVATTSANNDESVGNIIADAFMSVGPEGTVLFDMEDAPSTYIDVTESSQFKLGIAAREFFNKETKQEADYDNPLVLIINNDIKALSEIRPALKKAVEEKRPIAVFATDFSQAALNQFYMNFIQGNLKIVPIRIVGYAGNRRDIMQDISSLTGADVYDICPQGIEPRLGECDHITSSLTHTLLVSNNPSENYLIRINTLKEMIKNEKDGAIKKFMVDRLSQLRGKIAIVHVGGRTQVEAKERYDRVEDAICAVKASLEEGISEGGGMTYLRLSNISEMPDIIKQALKEPFNQLCVNADSDYETIIGQIISQGYDESGYNFLSEKAENLYEAGIIDPTKVIRLAIENATSVAMMLLTTSSIIDNE